jgi:AP2 domain/HNH endonuclease
VIEVPLTKGFVCVVDDADASLVSGPYWYAHKSRTKWYAAANVDGKRIMMHRLIMAAPAEVEVDHRDGDGLNNRRANLRRASHQENGFNKKLYENNTSGFIGVTWHKKLGKWRAQIRKGGRHHSLGCYLDPRDAALAYNAAALKLFGEFAKLNVL